MTTEEITFRFRAARKAEAESKASLLSRKHTAKIVSVAHEGQSIWVATGTIGEPAAPGVPEPPKVKPKPAPKPAKAGAKKKTKAKKKR
jgi:hypothetical protein